MIQQKVRNVKASTWIPETELEQINKLRGDVSISLFIKRAIRNAIKEEEEEEEENQEP